VVEALDEIARTRGRPKSLRVDNGPEFAGRMLDQWAYLNRVEIDFSRPGKPTDNAFVEAFNSRLRAECLNASWFLTMADASTQERSRAHWRARLPSSSRVRVASASRCCLPISSGSCGWGVCG
jgi:putative transposase